MTTSKTRILNKKIEYIEIFEKNIKSMRRCVMFECAILSLFKNYIDLQSGRMKVIFIQV